MSAAGWFWWPMATLAAVAAFVWMSILPEHGNHGKLRNILYYYWFELVALAVSCVAIIILECTRNVDAFGSTSASKIGRDLGMVLIAAELQHLALALLSPKSAMPSLKAQAKIFKDKHTYISVHHVVWKLYWVFGCLS